MPGGFPSLGDGPYYQGLAPATVAGGKHALLARHVLVIAADHALLRKRQPKRLGQPILGAGEADGQQNELAGKDQLRTMDFLELPLASLVKVLIDADGVQLLDVAAVVADEGLGLDLPVSLAALFVGRGDPEDLSVLDGNRSDRGACTTRFPSVSTSTRNVSPLSLT